MAFSTEQRISIGIVTANEEAVAAGAASLPDPASPGGADWMYWTWLPLVPTISFADGSGDVSFNAELSLDLRGRRKLIENNTDLVMLVGEESGATPSISLAASVLMLLP